MRLQRVSREGLLVWEATDSFSCFHGVEEVVDVDPNAAESLYVYREGKEPCTLDK